MKTTSNNSQNKREEKKRINIKWNSGVFFQIGVVVSLLTVFFVMQMNFEAPISRIVPLSYNSVTDPAMIDYVIDVETPKPVVSPKKIEKKREPIKKVVISNNFEVKPDHTPVVETPIAPNNTPSEELATGEMDNSKEALPIRPHRMATVEFVPEFPGCGNLASNAEKVACMSSNIDAFINKNFRKSLLTNLNPSQTYRVYVNFKINSEGIVTDVVANSHHKALTAEAQRVITKLPQMKPGKQGDKNVDVLYSVPIVLRIQ